MGGFRTRDGELLLCSDSDIYRIPLEGNDRRPGTSFFGTVVAKGTVKAQAHPTGPKRAAHAHKGH
jgi:hypothetical protein